MPSLHSASWSPQKGVLVRRIGLALKLASTFGRKEDLRPF